MARILLIDDDEKLLRVLTLRLEAMQHQVTAVSSAQEALNRMGDVQPALVLTDLRMPGMDGMELLDRLQHLRPGLPVILLTAHGDVRDAVAATQAGAASFLTKPVRKEELARAIEKHVGPAEPEPAPGGADSESGDLKTKNPRMRELMADVKRVAKTDCSVLINGPTGAGKEVLARALHEASPRASRPFVAMNCGAVPAELLESELFGHKKGAFTGATSDNLGLFRAAEGGTILLDEIGDMPAELQVKLLRVLEQREVRPVGEARSVPVDVRVLSATHRELEELITAGKFREDLFYRLNVVRLRIPPLDERREDIPLLVHERLRQLQARGAPKRVYSPDAMQRLCAASWPGNIRQLFNVVEQNVALSAGEVISVGQVDKALGEPEARSAVLETFDEARDAFSRDYLRRALELCRGNVSQTARVAGRNRTDIYKLLKKYDLDPKSFKPRKN